jgi:biopolymer transport protein ExbB
MRRIEETSPAGRMRRRVPVAGLILALALQAIGGGVNAAEPAPGTTRPGEVKPAARPANGGQIDLGGLERLGWNVVRSGLLWYERTPPPARVCWGGLVACAWLGLGVLLERLVRTRGRKIVPPDFTERFLDRLHEGKLDGGKALDYCEMNPSPAARVALAAVRRWGRPPADLERAVALAHRVESERLRVNVGTLRRIAPLAPLLGILGTLLAVGRFLNAIPGTSEALASVPWGRALAAALSPLTAGVAIGALALVSYDILYARIERLTGELDRLGAETIDAIAMVTPPPAPTLLSAPLHSRPGDQKQGYGHEAHGGFGAPHPQATHRRSGDTAEPRSHRDIGF